MVIGRLPLELLKELQETQSADGEEHEWALRKVKWALQPITRIAAAEHSLSVFEKEIQVRSTCNRPENSFKIHYHGANMGKVEATAACIAIEPLPPAVECA
jgi:hypothetical protein